MSKSGLLERFLRYTRVWTSSDEASESVPSTARQLDLARMLKGELSGIGADSVRLDTQSGCVYAAFDATPGCEDAAAIGFIAHMDTVPDFCGENVKARVIENYDGGDIVLGSSGRSITSELFPHIKGLAGRTLVVTDGTTVLGADDKAGIAAIMDAFGRIKESKTPHGRICCAFTPDEEIGRGSDGFDIEAFGADFAYTVDGGVEGEVVFENFNAASADIEIRGFNVHPGSAKDTMINASLVATELNAMLPSGESPRDTEGFEGFYHLTGIRGDVEKAEMHYIIRDHDLSRLEARVETMKHIAALLNRKYGDGTVSLNIVDGYRNMAQIIRRKENFHLVETAIECVRECGAEPVLEPIRGGTDGARLSFLGLPCPNLGTGGYAFHGPYEHVTLEGMEMTSRIIEDIVKHYSHFCK